MPTGQCAVSLLALAALAATACGDGATTATSAGAGGPAPAESGSAHTPPGRAKAPNDPAAKPPRSEALVRALATLDESDDPLARDAARREIVASGTAGLDALLDWLADAKDARRSEAGELIPEFGPDGFESLAGVLVADDPTNRTDEALSLLASHAMLWSRSEAAESIARAAWALCEDEAGNPNGGALAVVLAAGDLASFLAPEIVARFRGERAPEWLSALAHSGQIAGAAELCRRSAPDLVELLGAKDEEVWARALDLLATMRDPPEAAIEAILRSAAESTGKERHLAAWVAAAWGTDSAECANAARRLLSSDEPSVRRCVILGWSTVRTLSPDDFLAAARRIVDPEEDVSQAAVRLLCDGPSTVPGIAAAWRRALETAAGADAAALCAALLRFDGHGSDETYLPLLDSLLPSLLRIAAASDADAAVAAFRVLGRKLPEIPPQVAPLGISRLDDPDPRVRAWACWFADSAHDDGPPNDLDRRIAAAALPLIDSLPPSWERCRAFTAYWYANPEGGREIARRLISDPDPDMRNSAEYVLHDGPTVGRIDDTAVAALVRSLRDGAADGYNGSALGVLLRVDGGRKAALAWLEEWLLGETPDSKAKVLRLVVAERDAFADAIPIIRRLRDREGYAPVADVALAAMEPDDDTAVARLTVTLPAAAEGDRKVALDRLTDLGPRGAALIVRSLPPESTWGYGSWIAENERDTVVPEVEALASSNDSARRSHAIRWMTALPVDDAMRLLRTLVRDADDGVRCDAIDAATRVSATDAGTRAEVAAWSVPFVGLSGDHAPSELTRHRAVAALAAVPVLPDGGAAALRVAARAPELHVRSAAAAALVIHGASDTETLATLRAGLLAFAAGKLLQGGWYPRYDDDHEGFESLAVGAIARLGSRAAAISDALPRLAIWSEIRDDARLLDAIAKTGTAAEACVPALRSRLAQATRSGQAGLTELAAIRALAAIGAAARPAIPELQAAARVAELRDAAESAIRRIEAAR